ncbi:MAG: hypothetical protein L0209_02830, partial [candidate division Zixibacteria bacterium]|nr:hypothetical protein [candidate division Zixibacteria bacterium]
MKAKSRWASIVVGLMALAVLGLSCSKKSTSGGGGGGSTSSTPNITVGDDFFSPKTDSVAVGTMVTWTYNGPSVHTVTSDTGVVKE